MRKELNRQSSQPPAPSAEGPADEDEKSTNEGKSTHAGE